MEELVMSLVAKFPLAALVYGIAAGVYVAFSAIATYTTTKKDDLFRDKIKQFFSLPRR